jgi:hypothetical protein
MRIQGLDGKYFKRLRGAGAKNLTAWQVEQPRVQGAD